MTAGAECCDPILISTSRPAREAYDQILAVLRRFTTGQVGAPDNHDFAALAVHPKTGVVLGGLWAQSRWGAFLIDMIALPEELRGRGTGRQLISRAEAEARRRGCHVMWLETYEFQARSFYERLGFEVFGQLDGPAPIYPRYFMKKTLEPMSRDSEIAETRLGGPAHRSRDE